MSPFFSVLITAYNRADQIGRCVASCRDQTFEDLEIVVVDDASTDDTAAVLAAIAEPRLRVITHPVNRGISPARATTVQYARGEWLVMMDSDWELLPESLARLRNVIDELPAGVRIIRSRLAWDGDGVSPSVIPDGVTDYYGRLDWLEAVAQGDGGSDAGHCIHRDVFSVTDFPADRRGAVETLWETDLARTEPSMWVPDVLGIEHIDAVNSVTRDVSASRLIPRLLGEAPDQRWMAETMLARHGAAMEKHAPTYRRWLLESAMLESLLCGDRRAGVEHFRGARRAGGAGAQLWATLGLGLLGPRPLAGAKVAGRQWRSRQARAVSGAA